MKFYEEKIIFYLNTHSSCARQLVTNSGNFLFPQEGIEGKIVVQTSKTTWCMCNLPIKRMRKHETKSVRCEKPRSGKKGSKHRQKNTRFMRFTQIINGASASSTMKIIKGITRIFFFFFYRQESNIYIYIYIYLIS